MKFLLSLSCVLMCWAQYMNCLPSPTDVYLNNRILVGPDLYVLYWNYTTDDIVFETHVKTNAWAAFGLSADGAMDGSDVIVTWVDSNGKKHFSDRHIKGRNVLKDKNQNWFPLYQARENEYLITKFTRKIKLCDQSGEDLDIVTGTPRVIFSWNDELSDGDISYHGPTNRGSESVALISTINSNVKVDRNVMDIVDYRVNTTIPPLETEYYCHMFTLPEEWMKKKRHLYGFEVLMNNSTERHLHHFAITECQKSFESEFLKDKKIPKPGSCYPYNQHESNEWQEGPYKYCTKISLVWAVGGQNILNFPPELAYPMGEGVSESKYFFIEIHYDNPELKANMKDFSGIRLYGSTKYRQMEFGILAQGATETWTGQILPPKAESFRMDYHCRSECLNGLFDNTEEVKVFSAMPHAHLYGKSITTTVVRDGKEIEYLTNNQHYDFNYQQFNFLTEPVKLIKGDSLKTTCVYNTMSEKDRFIFGGRSTRDEMCLNFIWYYPRVASEVHYCLETIDFKLINNFLRKLNSSKMIAINDKLPESKQGHLNFTKIPNSKGKDLVKMFENFYDSTNRTGICLGRNGETTSINRPVKIEPIIEEKCVKSERKNIYLK